MKLFYKGIFAVILLAFISCKKESVTTVTVNESNSGGTVKVSTGQTIILTLLNSGGDGGYKANNPQFDASVLKQVSHVYTTAPANKVGGSGTDTWQLSALKSGSTPLKVIASRTPSDTITEFDGTISVQ